MSLYSQWVEAKRLEKEATDSRRLIEDQLFKELNLPEVMEGTKSWQSDGYKTKVTYRLNKKIDADLLQEVAAENGLLEHLGQLFRWKPEIVKKEWDAAAPEITRALEVAITTSVGRPSFSIEPVEE